MKIIINPELNVKKVANEIFILNRQTSEVIAFNTTGCALWEQITDGKSDSELATFLMNRYQIPKEVAEHDVFEYVSKLQNHAIIITE